MTIQRNSYIVPGYDCIKNPCGKNGCGRIPQRSHGRDYDAWVYSVSDNEVALVLEVSSGHFNDIVLDNASGRWIEIFTSFPTTADEVLGKSPSSFRRGDIEFPYRSTVSALEAENLYNTVNVTSEFRQREDFWQGLEKELSSRARQLRSSRMDHYHRCPHCDGTGIAIKDEK